MERMPDWRRRKDGRVEIENCPKCRGTGKDSSGNACTTCRGTGKLKSASEL